MDSSKVPAIGSCYWKPIFSKVAFHGQRQMHVFFIVLFLLRGCKVFALSRPTSMTFLSFSTKPEKFFEMNFSKKFDGHKNRKFGASLLGSENFDPARQGVRKNKNFSRVVYSRVFSKRGRVTSPFPWDQVSCD